ncbi:Protein FAR-RED IMPAIRED RESPONSE 1 [Hirschfeldia incana]|nr:Protein FAR-RED IMPAIRED RESPONSE 1 [Hirschfeldia incana]
MDLQESDNNNNQMSDAAAANMVESHNNNNRDVVVDDLRTGHLAFGGVLDLEPRDGINFDTHEAAYTFYQDYAKSMGFTTSIKNSRRSKKTKDFIDAKFACSRYGATPESAESSGGGTSSGRRSSVKKTDCKASMHVKRKPDGRWIIHEFIKEHNHELLPALAYHFRIQRNIKLAEKNNIDILHAVSERTRKMYVEMWRQSGGFKNKELLLLETSQVDKCRCLALEEGDSQLLLEYFKRIKKENARFFYAIDLNEEQGLRNLFWADAKSRDDYMSFNDVVSFDTTYVKFNDKLPLALFIGVNHHSQPMLLGCALVADESKETFVWLIKTWLRAMGGRAPKVMLTDQDKLLMAAVSEVLPNTRHCFALWHVLEKLPEYFSHVMKRHENFLQKFNKCVFRSWTSDQFDMRWWKMVSRFGLENDEWLLWLHEHRQKWVPTFMSDDVFLAGMSTSQRAESVNSFFDKYVHKKITLKEFLRQYGAMLQNRHEEESVADFDTWHKQPALKSPSPWEKQMAATYTHTIFKKFQVEVLGVVACHRRKEKEDENMVTFRVQDCEKDDEFVVTWSKNQSELCCFCRMFEYKGFLCRHALMILQMCGFATVPPRYILKRWTKDAKSGGGGGDQIQSRVQRYNELCSRAVELSEEGCVSEENYNIVLRTLVESLKNCVEINHARNNITESTNSQLNNGGAQEEENHVVAGVKATKKKTVVRKRKGQQEASQMLESQQSLQPMENISSEGMNISGYYGPQQNVQGLLNLMEPPHEGYYVNQRTIQGLGQLNSIAPVQDSFFTNQQGMPGLGQMDFRPPPNFTYNLQDEHLRSAQLPGSSSRQL